MKLILVRHGETLGNIAQIHEGGTIGGKLSIRGKEQAKRLAKRLKDDKFDAIFSSPLNRAKQTLKEIKKYHKNTPITFLKEMRELDRGDWAGKKISECDLSNPPKNLETYHELKKRAKKALDIAYKEYPTGTVLFVAHGWFNKALYSNIIEKDMEEIKDFRNDNTAVNIFEIFEDRKHKIHLINCTKHL